MSAVPQPDPTLLLAHLDFVRALSRQLCADANEADDLAQETLGVALARAPAGLSSPRSWLASVVRNLASNRRRAARRRSLREAAAPAPDGVPTSAEIAAREELRRRVVEAVMAMPEPFRAVVLLRHYRGLDTRATARELGVPDSTVRTRLKRAVEQLRAQLDHEHGGDRARWRAALLPFALPAAGPSDTATEVGGATSAPTPAAIVWIAAAATVLLAVGLSRLGDRTPARAPSPSPATASTPLGANTHAAAGDASARPFERQAVTGGATGSAAGAPRELLAIVTDRAARPFAGAEVSAWLAIGSSDQPIAARIGSARTGADGTATLPLAAIEEFSPLARGELVVVMRADADGHSPETASLHLHELPPSPASTVELRAKLLPEHLIKGRVVTPDGRPVPLAKVAIAPDGGDTETGVDGSFALHVPEPAPADGVAVLVAGHPAHGLSAARHAAVAASGDTRVGDLVLDRPLGVLTGTVRFAGGGAVGNVEVQALRQHDGDAGPERTVVGSLDVAFADYDATFAPWGHVVETDRDGRFALRNLRPGRYAVFADDDDGAHEHRVVTVAAMPVDVELVVPDGDGQLHVRIEDRDGRRLHDACYVRHAWRGAAADEAARAYARHGATPALLASADERDGCYFGFNEWLVAEPDTFVVLAAGAPGAGPAYGACRLAAGQRRGEVRIVLEPRVETGSVHLVVRDSDGAPLPVVRARFSPVAGERALPVLVAGLAGASLPRSRIFGPWHEVPADGRVAGLPPGRLSVELLGAAGGDRRHTLPFPIRSAEVEVRAGQQATLDVTCERGLPLELELRSPPPGPGERLSLRNGEAWVQAEGRAHPDLLHLAPADGGRELTFAGGSCVVRPRLLFVPGRYTVRLQATVARERFEPAHDDVPARWVPAGVCSPPGVLTVELGPTAAPFVVEMTPN